MRISDWSSDVCSSDLIVRNLGAEDHKVRLLSEAIGAGVKKLHYGESTPTARCFDIRVNERWLPEDERAEAFGRADLERAPLLWRGRFDPERIEEQIGRAHV